MTELRKERTSCERNDFTTETLEIIDRIVNYERETTRLNREIEQLNKEIAIYKSTLNDIRIDVEIISQHYSDIHRTSNKNELLKVLDTIYDDTIEIRARIRKAGVDK